jgi:hypothetical protein
LARQAARRGLRALGVDRLRSAELYAVLVDVELASGDVAAAAAAVGELDERLGDIDVPSLQTRSVALRARVRAAQGDVAGAVQDLERLLDEVDESSLPWLYATLLFELACLHHGSGDDESARPVALRAEALVSGLDVVALPRHSALLEAVGAASPVRVASPPAASLRCDGRWWDVEHDGVRVRLGNTKGLRYLAELVSRPGAERHVLDLVDLVEGISTADTAIDRRQLGDAGEMSDPRAREAYRRRIEVMRCEIDDALAAEQLEKAEALQAGLDELVAELARAFGLGGGGRRVASAAERARLNVTRALRSAISKLAAALPDAGDVLDRRIRTGLYCAYEPVDGEVAWVVRSESFSTE